MRLQWTGLELRVELRCDEPWVVFDLNYFHEACLRRSSRNDHSLLQEHLFKFSVELRSFS